MGLGSTAKKVQLIAEKAESTYEQLVKLRDRMTSLEETLGETSDRVAQLERENEAQRILLEKLAEERGIDVDAALAEAAITDLDEEVTTDEVDTTDEADTTDEVDTIDEANTTDEADTTDDASTDGESSAS